MKEYDIHGKDFHKLDNFMRELINELVNYKPCRANGFFIDVEIR